MEIPIQVADIAVVYDNDNDNDNEDYEDNNDSNDSNDSNDDYDNYGNRYDSNPITKTANGGNAFKSTGSAIVDYFMLFMRDLSISDSYDHLEKCWKEDPKKTVAIIFNGRDRLNGKKEKKVANEAMLWLRKNKFETYMCNIKLYVEKYGRWKDLLYISYNLKNIDHKIEMNIIAQKLIDDKINLDNNKPVSLCAKWAPSENDRNDRQRQFAKKVASVIYGCKDTYKMSKYRKQYLVPLRKQIDIVESKMCDNKWEEIKYENIPGVASNKLKNAFIKHDEERYKKYLGDVATSVKKINVTGILPHELAGVYIKDLAKLNKGEVCQTTEMQWKAIVENVRKSGNFDNAISIVDVSGSMFNAKNGSIPAQVAVALGIITALCCKGDFANKIITFSENPELVDLITANAATNSTEKPKIENGDASYAGDASVSNIPSLHECIKNIMGVDYGFSTDFLRCNEEIINYAIKYKVPQDKMPKKLFVFTDMQFNNTITGNFERDYRNNRNNTNALDTVYKSIVKLYEANNYKAPKFIFWNLNSDSNEVFPVNCDTEGTAIVSGFSEQLLKIFMNYDEFKPEFIVNEILAPYLEDIIINDD
uniref:TROVE domain-containing protein n=1 Tax=viral metagenome TaxID=1070528 RepID=A0A6C0LCZ3_9ZZZZ